MMAKEEKVSLEEAANAYILLLDSGGGSTRRLNRVLGMLRDAVKSKEKGVVMGPIMPDDERPELDEDQEQAVEERFYDSARVYDLVHPGGRMQKARETIDTITKKAEEGTLAEDGARKIAADAKEKAAEYQKEAKKSSQKEAKTSSTAAPATPASASMSTSTTAPSATLSGKKGS